MIARYRARAGVVLAVLILGLAGIVALAGPAAAATTASFSASGWETGFTGQYTISNSGPGTVNSWQLQFDLPAGTQVGSFWDANMTRAGNHYTFTNRNYNATIAVGASVSFGFVASGTGRPSNCTVNGAACGGGGTTTTGPTTTTRPTTTTGPTTTTRPTTTTGPTTTGPTTTIPQGTLPRHTLTGYWHNFDNRSTVLRLRDVPAAYDVVAVAFAEADPARRGAVTFAVDPGLSAALGGYTDNDFAADVQTMRSRGKKVILSVGGERGTVSVGDSTAAANFANSMAGLINRFGFDGVDIDLENGLNPTAMASALRQLRSTVGSNLIITLAPQTIDMQSTGGSYFQLALNIKDILTVVHTQYYNSGSMLGCDQGQAYSQGTVNFLTALACIQLENGLRPDQVALGLPASPSAAGGGFQNPSSINNALDCLARGTNCGSFRPPRTYPSIRGVMTWSVNWDVVAGRNFSNTVKAHLGTLP